MFRPWANTSSGMQLGFTQDQSWLDTIQPRAAETQIQAARKAPCTALVSRKRLGTRAEISMSALLSPTNRSYLLLT